MLTWGRYPVRDLDGKQFLVDDPRIEPGTGVSFSVTAQELELTLVSPSKGRRLSEAELVPRRFSLGTTDSILLEPALPDHPLIIRPDQPYSIVPDGSAEVFIEVPLSLAIILPGKRSQRIHLAEINFAPLSKSWFGEVTAGELSYSLESSLPAELKDCAVGNGYAVCPISITNETPQLLDFQRMYLRVQHLTIYKGSQKNTECIITDATQVVFRGEDAVSQISYDKRVDRFVKDLKKIEDPREPESRNVLKRSLFFIKSLTLS